MLRAGERIGLILWGLSLLATGCFGQTPPHRTEIRALRPNARSAVAPAPVPALPAAPPVPLTMAQQPSVAPQVSYRDGMLTIVAQNSTLGDILREVHKSTGAVIDVPSSATERVVARIGPGPAREVLAELLNGSAFNYVMIGSPANPASLTSVSLTMKPAGGASAGGQAAAVYQPPQQYMPPQVNALGTGPGGPVVQAPPSDEEAEAEEKEEEEPDQDQAEESENGAVPAQDGSQPNAGPKTPEQILEMLRQRPGQVTPGQPIPIPQQQPQSNDDN